MSKIPVIEMMIECLEESEPEVNREHIFLRQTLLMMDVYKMEIGEDEYYKSCLKRIYNTLKYNSVFRKLFKEIEEAKYGESNKELRE